MNVKQAIRRATDLCERIAAPDFAPCGRQVRLVPFSIARRWSARLACGHCGGWTSTLLDVLLRDHLDLPTGSRAFVAIIRDDVLPNEAAIVNVALHELAHDLADLQTAAASSPVTSLGALADLRVENLPASFASKSVLPDHTDHHGERFHRAAAHVAARAARAGWQTSLAALHPCRARIAQSLGDEPREREAEPITVILESQPPTAFSKFWSAAI